MAQSEHDQDDDKPRGRTLVEFDSTMLRRTLFVIFAAVIVFFLVYYNTFFGVREVSGELIAAVRIMGANRLQLALRVIIPSALVWVAAGLKISVPYALVGVVVAEMTIPARLLHL